MCADSDRKARQGGEQIWPKIPKQNQNCDNCVPALLNLFFILFA